jgi:CheY-like chemotaxis protein
MDVQSAIPSPNWEGKIILIGEDEMVNFKLLEMILLKTKVRILHGKTGVEVLELFKSNPDVSLILMDIKMPEMDGIEATNEIRKLNNTIPIIAQTAYALEDERVKCMNTGFNEYITKPINRRQLITLMISLIK